LHRSEGFGLVLAEAMALGKPVVATGWSGNMDFMTSFNYCPVDCRVGPLGRDYPPYRAGQRWAEPDPEHAAHFMRQLLDDAGLRGRMGARAGRDMRERLRPAAVGALYARRLRDLGLVAD